MKTLLTLALFAGLAPALIKAQQPAQQPELHNINVRGGIYMIVGDSTNVTVQTGKQGVVVINSGSAALAPVLLAEIRKIAPRQPVRYLINTSSHQESVAGNEALSKLIPPNRAQPLLIVAHENVLNRLTIPPADNPIPTLPGGLPTDEYELPFKDFHYNGEAVFVYHEPNAITDGDSIILFRGTDAIATGEIYDPEGYPNIDLARGGSIQGEINALDNILDLTVPEDTEEGGTLVIPARGRISEEDDVVEYRDMVVIIRDRVKDGIKKGLTLDQIKAARPTMDYDTQYILPDSKVTSDAFVETIYKSLTAKPSQTEAKK